MIFTIGRSPFQIPLGAWPGFENQSCYEAPGYLLIEIWIRNTDINRFSKAAFSTVAESWPLGSHIDNKKYVRLFWKWNQVNFTQYFILGMTGELHHQKNGLWTCFFIVYIFWHTQIMKNHVFCYNSSCVNVCEIRISHLLHLFIRYKMYHFLYWK